MSHQPLNDAAEKLIADSPPSDKIDTSSSNAVVTEERPRYQGLKLLRIHEMLNLKLPSYEYLGRPPRPHESSTRNKRFYNITFDFDLETLFYDDPGVENRLLQAIDFLDPTFRTPQFEVNPEVRVERDISKRNSSMFTPFLVQMANSLCPENYVVAHFLEATEEDVEVLPGDESGSAFRGRIDHIIGIKKISSAMTAAELANCDFGTVFKKPSAQEWMELQDCKKDKDGVVQSLMGIEDKRSINLPAWKDAQDMEAPLGTAPSREVKLDAAQLLKYAQLFKQRRLSINNGDSFILFEILKEDMEKISSIYAATVKADAIECKLNGVLKLFLRMLFEALEEKFGQFNKEAQGWVRGGKIRGAVEMVQGFHHPKVVVKRE
ncbi:unnamed protein product [Cyclocybe aegerita]|uniref:Uncharacterized protein n=1 Tax=Cyclocybe aegerita TaxID=1973307 RepID=A0A8S0X592_CYCAE|nr:unnamed protein product [Cyclocybe aegerita]